MLITINTIPLMVISDKSVLSWLGNWFLTVRLSSKMGHPLDSLGFEFDRFKRNEQRKEKYSFLLLPPLFLLLSY